MQNTSVVIITLITLYLHFTHSLYQYRHQRTSNVKYFAKSKNAIPDLPDVSDNKDMDVDALKRVHIPRAKYSRKRKQNIGRATPTAGSYSQIGDGVYMLRDDPNASKDSPASVSSSKTSLLNFSPSQSAIKIHKIDVDNQALATHSVNFKARFDSLPYDEDYVNMKDLAAHQNIQSNNVAFELGSNIEGMTGADRSMLQTIESNLKVDDKMAGMHMAKDAEAAHMHEQILKNPKGLSGFQKAILEGSKELELASESEKELYIKDATSPTMKRDKIQLGKNSNVGINESDKRPVKSEILHYEDVDTIDSPGEKRNLKRRKVKNKKRKQRKLRKHNQRNNKMSVKSSVNSKKISLSNLEHIQEARLVKILNNTDNANPKLHLKSKVNTLKITNATLLHGTMDGVKTRVVAFTKGKANSTGIRENKELIQTRKSEVVQEVIGNRRYIASQAAPDNNNGYYEATQGDEQMVSNFVNSEDKELDSNKHDVNQAEYMQATPPESLSAPVNKPSSVGDVVPQKENNFGKATKAEMEDALADFNSAEIKSAMANSDLNGLNQIKKAVDEQNTKNSVDYFNQPQLNLHSKNSSEVSLGELSEEFKEAQQDSSSIANPKTEGYTASTTGKVKQYVIHLPDGEKDEDATMETINEITENAEQLFSSSKGKKKEKGKDYKATEAVLLLEKLLEQETHLRSKKPTKKTTTQTTTTTTSAQKFDKSIDDSLIEKIINSKAFKKLFVKPQQKEPTVSDSNSPDDELSESSHSTWHEMSSPENDGQTEESESSAGKEDMSGAYKAFIRNIHKQALSGDKFQGSEGTMESFNKNELHKLQVGGGKIVGGSVRGGNIQGGYISGGDVSGGEIDGGKISGGTFKGGTLVGGIVKDGIVEGGKIRGGQVLGGLVRSGLIDGGIIKGGIVEGGHLVNGTIEGGDFKGGEMLGGKLTAGEIDGGVIKGGKVAGGTLRGGVIESGSLEGGIMLAGLLRGGIVKSGIIRGGVIDKGVIVQDNAEIGPGVEIHDGIVKGGRITVSHDSQSSSSALLPSKRMYLDLPSPRVSAKSSIFHLQLTDEAEEPKKKDSINEKPHHPHHPIKSSIASAKAHRKSHPSVPAFRKDTTGTKRQLPPPPNQQKQLEAAALVPQQPTLQSMFQQFLNQPTNPSSVQQFAQSQEKFDSSTASPFRNKPIHWAMVGSTRGVVLGDFPYSPKLRMSGDGVTFRNGHAILDGESGFFDAGDYRGECFSDPEVCEDGFTIHLTLKVYGDSMRSSKKLFIFDSGAVNKDSRGISIWVSEGMIKGLIATRKQTYCISEDFQQFADRWLVLTLTWRSDAGASIYFDCEMFDQSQFHHTVECEPQCPDCHQMDVATRLMFGRPNKGPHFKVIHMAIGDILMFEKYHDADEVRAMCGTGHNQQQVQLQPVMPQATLQDQIQPITTQAPQQQQNQNQQGNQSGQQTGQPEQQGSQSGPQTGQSGQQGSQPGNQGGQSEQQGSQSGQQSSQSGQEGSQTGQQPQPTQSPQLPTEQAATTTTPLPPPTMTQFLNEEQKNALSAIAPALSSNVARLLQNLHPGDSEDGPTGSQLYPSPQIQHFAAVKHHLPTPIAQKVDKPQPAHAQGISRSTRPSAKSQYPSPPVVKVGKEEERAPNKPVAVMRHKVMPMEGIVYPTPPGLSKENRIWFSKEPAPLIDYTTDRRSQLAHHGYTQWSGWSSCVGKCDIVQVAIRHCQSKRHNCLRYGPAKRFRTCQNKKCKDYSRSKKHSIASKKPTKKAALKSDSLETQLNRLKR